MASMIERCNSIDVFQVFMIVSFYPRLNKKCYYKIKEHTTNDNCSFV